MQERKKKSTKASKNKCSKAKSDQKPFNKHNTGKGVFLLKFLTVEVLRAFLREVIRQLMQGFQD
ncbi:hypothetical protein [Aeromonas veronii]|uniref:hypothetical protein n=1 Tax=Aeromonas veronii TaxID=654 RepID=UPI00111B9DA3|nr:hypothetical protein [Aeromonas veronii]